MKDAARLLAYFAGTLLAAALLAPVLYWTAQSLAVHDILPRLAGYDFSTVFHRALLLSAILLLWPLLRSLRLDFAALGLQRNANKVRDIGLGFGAAAIPLLCCGGTLIWLGIYSLRNNVQWAGMATVAIATIVVPVIEEWFFRGLLLGILLRQARPIRAVFLTSALFSILHFLKSPDETAGAITWMSGFAAIAAAFSQFAQPLLVLAGFTTLFLLGWILADARLRTGSLALPIGLHAGWIFSDGIFNRFARRQTLALPWIGKDLSIGIAPLAVALLTWGMIWFWLRRTPPPAIEHASS